MSSEKKRRGRPRLPLSEDPYVREQIAYANVGDERARDLSRRHQLNVAYWLRGAEALWSDESGEKADDTFPIWLAQSVVSELGRWGERAQIRAAAQRLLDAMERGECSHRAQDQVALLRSWRRGLPPATVSGLAHVLLGAIERYAEQHGGMSDQVIVGACERVLAAYRARAVAGTGVVR